MSESLVERLAEPDLDLVRPLLAELYYGEQPHFPEHPQLSREQLLDATDTMAGSFQGENVIFVVRDGDGNLAAFCWCVLFDPGSGLEGEVAEVFVLPQHRGRGHAGALLQEAVKLFSERGVTLGYVWTREANESAVRLYRGAGFEPTRQLVLTWYPKR